MLKKVQVKIEITWGRKWNGSYEAMTNGEGAYVTCSEYRGNSFSGCPLGRVNFAYVNVGPDQYERAIADFMRYGKPEYRGDGTLTRDKIEIVAIQDWRQVD